MSPAEHAAARTLHAEHLAELRALARRWIGCMQHRLHHPQLEIERWKRPPGDQITRIEDLAGDGVDEEGRWLWWNDGSGSTRIREWEQVRRDVSLFAPHPTPPAGKGGS